MIKIVVKQYFVAAALGVLAGVFMHSNWGKHLILALQEYEFNYQASKQEEPLSLSREWSLTSDSSYRRVSQGLYGRWCHDCGNTRQINDHKSQGIELICRIDVCTFLMKAGMLSKDNLVVDTSIIAGTMTKGEVRPITFQSLNKDWVKLEIVSLRAI